MLLISEIHERDIFANPLWRTYNPPGNLYRVEQINFEEKLVRVQTYGGSNMKPILKPFWKKSTDKMFSESWRLL